MMASLGQEFVRSVGFLARFDPRQIGSRLPARGRRVAAPAQSGAPRFPTRGTCTHAPCPTASGLMGNGPENAAPQRFLSARGPEANGLGSQACIADKGSIK